MGTTAKGLRYPENTGLVTNGWQDIKNLADDVDGKLPALTSGAAPTMATGWTLDVEGYTMWKVPLATGVSIIFLQVHVIRAVGAATITPGASSNITDVDVFTLAAAYRPSARIMGLVWQVQTGPFASGKIGTDGVCTIQEFGAGGSIAAGASMRITATYLTAS